MKAPKDLALLTPDCLPCAQPGPPSSHPAEVGRPIKSRRWLRCNILRHGQAQLFRVCDIVATGLVRRDTILMRFPGPVQGSGAAGGIAAKVVRQVGTSRSSLPRWRFHGGCSRRSYAWSPSCGRSRRRHDALCHRCGRVEPAGAGRSALAERPSSRARMHVAVCSDPPRGPPQAAKLA